MLFPKGYGRSFETLDELRHRLVPHYHPEYLTRLLGWLQSQGGQIGVGGGFRSDGTQPDLPGFAPEGRSFHQNQEYSDGFIGAAAVDLVARNGINVHRSPRWDEVPVQGSDEAVLWGVHCNVSGEPWHLQPIEIDGYGSWIRNGSPAPVPNYPFPNRKPESGGNTVTVYDTVYQDRRLFDTRDLGGRAENGQVIEVGVPAGAGAVTINLAVDQPIGPGWAAAYPNTHQGTSSINFSSGQTVANQIDVKAGSDGKFRILVHTSCHVIVDLVAAHYPIQVIRAQPS